VSGAAARMTELHEDEQVQPPPGLWLSPIDQALLLLSNVAYRKYGLAFGYKGLSSWGRNWWARLWQLRVDLFLIADIKIGEAVFLRRGDFDLGRRYLEIEQLYRRNGGRMRMAFPIRSFTEEGAEFLRRSFTELRLGLEDYVLSGSPEPIRPYAVWRSLRLIAKAAGVDPQPVHPETFRKLQQTSGNRIIKILLGDESNWLYKHPPRRRARGAEAQGQRLLDILA